MPPRFWILGSKCTETGILVLLSLLLLVKLVLSGDQNDTLKQYDKPTFTVYPSDHSVNVGETVTIDCSATGYPEPTITWKRKTLDEDETIPPVGETRFSIAENGTLTIKLIEEGDAAIYLCWATNSVGASWAIARLEIMAKPTIKIEPAEILVDEGQSVTLDCHVTGNPDPTVFWSRGTGQHLVYPSEEHNRFSVDKTGTLRIKEAEVMDAGVYRCHAINVVGASISTVNVSVKAQTLPTIADAPRKFNVSAGSIVVISCLASGVPRPTIGWVQDSRPVNFSDPRFRMLESGSIQISDVRAEDSGQYTCWASNVKGKTTRSATLTVAAQTLPTIADAPREFNVSAGSIVVISCLASGVPRPTIKWVQASRPVNITDPRFLILESGSLKILDVRVKDSGQYTCRAVNVKGEATQSANLTVTEVRSRPEISMGPQDSKLSVGATAQIPCVVSGDPQPIVGWYHDGRPIIADERIIIMETGSIQIQDLRTTDSGTYTCKVTNGFGETNQSASLLVTEARTVPITEKQTQPTIDTQTTPTIETHTAPTTDIRTAPTTETQTAPILEVTQTAPAIAEGPGDSSVPVGSNVIMPCGVTGSPRPFVRWYHDGRPVILDDPRVTIIASDSLQISDLRLTDRGTYTCKASNVVGEAAASGSLALSAKACPCLDVPNYGEVTVFGNQPGDVARFACDAGFTMIGQEYVHCGKDGQWSSTSPECRDGLQDDGVHFADCFLRTPDRHTLLFLNYQLLPSNTSSKFSHGAELEARCVEIGRYTFHGSHNIACINGHWSEEVPFCTPNDESTGNFTPVVDFKIDKGQYVITPDGRLAVRPGAKVIFTCHYNNTEDWFLYWVNEHRRAYPTRETDDTTLELTIASITEADSGEFSCYNLQRVGRTSVNVIVEEWACPESVITSQNLVLLEEDNQLGGRAVFRCADGYKMEGSNTSICRIGGKWYPPSPVCKGSACPCLGVSANMVARTQRNDQSYHTFFTCLPGYQLNGSSDIVCEPNGTWSDSVPTCIEIDCGKPPGFSVGRLAGNKTTLGGIFLFWCKNGIIPEGISRHTRCQADGKWSHKPPLCLEIRCDEYQDECFTMNCSEHSHYLIPRDERNRRYSCCGNDLIDMRSSICYKGHKVMPCSEGFSCDNNNCVPNAAVCDGNNDCSDGTDERGCIPCDGTQFRCRDGQCVSFSHVCNRAKDCFDGTDEVGCSRGLAPIEEGELAWCGQDEFTCPGDRVCLPINKVCDGHYDCDGGYDEEQCGDIHCNPSVEVCRTVSCPGGSLAFVPLRTRYVEWGCCRNVLYSRKVNFCSAHGIYPCPLVSFRCRNGNCVPPRWQCDSENDCSDGSDEVGCHGCPSHEYNCGDRQCVHISRVCDKKKDCYNGMDECHCARSDGRWCGGKQYRCFNDNCIAREFVCNHKDDCGDGSDEVKCTPED